METPNGTEKDDEYREARGKKWREFWAMVIGVAIGTVVSKGLGL
ncbi:hypothetical protein OIE62_07405 [Streptomyces scopuliridis]|uniref:Uncharacterized protein n=1 Tax=Streptomyces scopuliridis TaxID=452529 RepID=A0ACD4ZT29_9ACTN|nr:hypothetical protein [Streptomyces scopuliridis]WSC01601.1 hypothetical protein OG835_34415 [Streptomyces scopuliridis]WSC04860.1 hypothetical protein OIE62_07405 [Streptomyces scopuliridis]